MIERLVDFSIRNRALVIFGVLLMGAVGLRSAQQLPIDAVPDVTNVQVQVLTTAPALGPLEVEKFITFPVETVMSGLPKLAELRSLSKFGLSSVTIVFEEGTDIYFARQLVAERLAQARESIPKGYGSPTMGPISTGLGEIYQFTVQGDGRYTAMELRTVLDWYIAYQLRAVPGVVEVNTFGGELKTYEVGSATRGSGDFEVTYPQGAVRMRERVAVAGTADHPGQHRRLAQGEVGQVEGHPPQRTGGQGHREVPPAGQDVHAAPPGAGVGVAVGCRPAEGQVVHALQVILGPVVAVAHDALAVVGILGQLEQQGGGVDLESA